MLRLICKYGTYLLRCRAFYVNQFIQWKLPCLNIDYHHHHFYYNYYYYPERVTSVYFVVRARHYRIRWLFLHLRVLTTKETASNHINSTHTQGGISTRTEPKSSDTLTEETTTMDAWIPECTYPFALINIGCVMLLVVISSWLLVYLGPWLVLGAQKRKETRAQLRRTDKRPLIWGTALEVVGCTHVFRQGFVLFLRTAKRSRRQLRKRTRAVPLRRVLRVDRVSSVTGMKMSTTLLQTSYSTQTFP